MESAIPEALRCTRSRNRRIPDDYRPPYPAVVARFPGVTHLVIACFGIQWRGDVAPPDLPRALAWLKDALEADGGADHRERSTGVDGDGFATLITTAYWRSAETFDQWFSATGSAWTALARWEGLGRFTEVVRPRVERLETTTEQGYARGVAALADTLSAPVQEIGYWGAARDRIALSQTSDLAPSGVPTVIALDRRRRVRGHTNLCVIRSGQDWSGCVGAERDMYLGKIQPDLQESMDFLGNQGRRIGCFANRYMTIVDDGGAPRQETFGMSFWSGLSALERWAEAHWTHLGLYVEAMKLYSSFGAQVKLKRWHEMAVVAADEQFFEYVDCHPKTGMLGVVTSA